MTREGYHQTKQIFYSAVELAPEERSLFLDEQCGKDGELRREVERLLTAKVSEFIEEPAIAQVADVIGKEHKPTKFLIDPATNNQFGHFRIMKQIGKGGMGEVYLAQDTKLNRKVAIKLLTDELSKDREKLNRFIQEAQSARNKFLIR